MNQLLSRITPSLRIVSIYLLVLIIGIWAVVIPEVKNVASLQGQLDSLRSQQSSAAGAKKTNISSDNNQANYDLVNLLVPKTDMQYDLTVQIEGLYKSLGIPLGSLTVAGGTAPVSGTKTTSAASTDSTSGWSKLAISMTTTTSYVNIQKLLAGLVSLNRLVQIDQISLTQAGNSTTDNVSAQISAFAFYKP